jgi:hypothetical protein
MSIKKLYNKINNLLKSLGYKSKGIRQNLDEEILENDVNLASFVDEPETRYYRLYDPEIKNFLSQQFICTCAENGAIMIYNYILRKNSYHESFLDKYIFYITETSDPNNEEVFCFAGSKINGRELVDYHN